MASCENRVCFGLPPLRNCRRGSKTCESKTTVVPRVWTSTFSSGCGADIYELDATGSTDACFRQSISRDYAVLATHPKTGVVYGVGSAPYNHTNLTCETATVISPFENGLMRGNTCQGALNNPPECGFIAANQAPGVWYLIPPQEEGTSIGVYTCSPCTMYNTMLFLYSGSCGNLVCEQASSQEFPCEHSSFHSAVTFNAEQGKQYYVYVTGIDQLVPPAAAGQFDLWVTLDGTLYVPDGQGGTAAFPYDNVQTPEPIGKNCGTTLFRLDPRTCTPVSIGPGFDGIGTITDVAFPNNPVGEPELYVFAADRPIIQEQLHSQKPTYSLHAVSLRTGKNRRIGSVFTMEQTRIGNGIAFDCDDRLWLVSKLALLQEGEGDDFLADDNPAELFELNPETAQIISSREITYDNFPEDFLPFPGLNPRMNALAYNKCTDQMFVAVRDIVEPFAFGFNAVNAVGYLASLDVATATVSMINRLSVPFLQGLTTELLLQGVRCEKPQSRALGGGAQKSATLCTQECCDRVASLPHFGQCLPRDCARKTCSSAETLPRLRASAQSEDSPIYELFVRSGEACRAIADVTELANAVVATHPKTGAIYGTAEINESDLLALFVLDPATGEPQTIAMFELADFVAFGDAAFRSSDANLVDINDSLLYVSFRTDSHWTLAAVGLRDANVVVLGQPFSLPRQGGAIAFDGCNKLQWADKQSDSAAVLQQMSAFDASLDDAKSLEFVGFDNVADDELDVWSLTYDACTKSMFALITKEGEDQQQFLARLHVSTGVVEKLHEIDGPVLKSITAEILAARCKK